MTDKERLFIVVYLNISNFSDQQNIKAYIYNISNSLKYDDTINTLVIPVRDSETRIECINPMLLNKEQYKEVENKINEFKEKINEQIRIQ